MSYLYFDERFFSKLSNKNDLLTDSQIIAEIGVYFGGHIKYLILILCRGLLHPKQ